MKTTKTFAPGASNIGILFLMLTLSSCQMGIDKYGLLRGAIPVLEQQVLSLKLELKSCTDQTELAPGPNGTQTKPNG